MTIKICKICDKEFDAKAVNTGVCSFDCRRELVRQYHEDKPRRQQKRKAHEGSKIRPVPVNMSIRRACKPCVVCGWFETTDLHHDVDATYILCPNHHALITRGIRTIGQLLSVDNSVSASQNG